MRDWWYEQVNKMYPKKYIKVEFLDNLDKINTNLENIRYQNQESQTELLNLK